MGLLSKFENHAVTKNCALNKTNLFRKIWIRKGLQI